MMKKQLRRKAGSVIVRNTLAFALGAVLAAAPAVGWAGASVSGNFESGGSVPYTAYDSLAAAVDEVKTFALEGPGEDEETSRSNDLSVDIHLDSAETVSGLLLDGTKYDSDGNPELSRGFKNISIDGHGYGLDGSGNSEDEATILYIANTSGDISISNLNFLNGNGKEKETDDPSTTTYGGAGLLINPNRADGAATANFETVTLTNITFQNNQGTITNGANSAGGGMTIFSGGAGQGSILSMTDLNLIRNTSQTNIGIGLGTSNAFGGGAGLTNLDIIEYTGGLVSGNQALSNGGQTAGGGGLHVSNYGSYTADFQDIAFSSNTAQITGAGNLSDTALALGGAYYGELAYGAEARTSFSDGVSFSGNKAAASGAYAAALGGGAAFLGAIDTSFDGVDFTNNTATAGGTLGSEAYGGAVYTESSSTFVNSDFIGNSAAGDMAYGGALYTLDSASFRNSSFIDNSAVGATAYGGAIFMDASVATGGPASVLEMAVEAGQIVEISGNTAGGRASGVYFGNAAADLSQKNGEFTIENDGRMLILDPLTVALNNDKSFTLNVEGEGSLFLTGKSSISAEGGTEINFSQGMTEVTKDFTLVVINDASSNFEMNITKAGTDQNTFIFDTRQESPMIDLTGAGNSKSFLVEANAMTFETTDGLRQLVDNKKTLVIVAGAGTGAEYLAGQFNTQQFERNYQNSSFAALDGNVVLELDYTSPFTDALKRAGNNTFSGASALHALLQYDEITEEMLEYIHANYNALTPEYGLVAGAMGMNVNQFVSRMAVRQGLRGQHNSSLPIPLSVQPSFGGSHEGARVWAGYAGNFRKVDNSGGYYGYDQDTSAAMLGLSYDLGPGATIGIYGAYSNNKAKMNNISSEVESDGTHLGLLARLTPGASVDPNLAIYLDAGYSRYENDAYRRLGGEKIRSDFDQTAYTAGIGAEYAVPVSYEVLLTPSLDLRYTKLEQDSYREQGFIAGHLKGYDVNSFTSSLALTASREISIRGGTITPSARLGWNHEYGDTDVNTTARYLNPSGGLMPTTYKMSTVTQNRDSMDAGVGLRALLNSGSYHQVGLNVSYDVNISKEADTHSVYGGLEYSF